MITALFGILFLICLSLIVKTTKARGRQIVCDSCHCEYFLTMDKAQPTFTDFRAYLKARDSQVHKVRLPKIDRPAEEILWLPTMICGRSICLGFKIIIYVAHLEAAEIWSLLISGKTKFISLEQFILQTVIKIKLTQVVNFLMAELPVLTLPHYELISVPESALAEINAQLFPQHRISPNITATPILKFIKFS